METGTFASGSAIRLLERLAYRINAVIHSRNPRSVHDLRVAIRRFNQSLAVFKGVFEPREARKIRRRVDDLMDLTGDIRDCDIACELLEKSELPGAAPLIQQIRARRKLAMRTLLPALRRWAERRTTAKSRAALSPVAGTNAPLEDTVRGRLPRIARKFLKNAGRAQSASEMHRARIEGKKLRYSLEILQPALGAPVADAVKQMKRLQTALGDVNDCHAARLLVRELGGDREVEAWLRKRQRKKAREFHAAWDESSGALRQTLRVLKHPEEKAGIAAAGA